MVLKSSWLRSADYTSVGGLSKCIAQFVNDKKSKRARLGLVKNFLNLYETYFKYSESIFCCVKIKISAFCTILQDICGMLWRHRVKFHTRYGTSYCLSLVLFNVKESYDPSSTNVFSTVRYGLYVLNCQNNNVSFVKTPINRFHAI
jgi:hypothetical protein